MTVKIAITNMMQSLYVISKIQSEEFLCSMHLTRFKMRKSPYVHLDYHIYKD